LGRLDNERGQLQRVPEPAFQAIVAPHLSNVLDNGAELLRDRAGVEVMAQLRDANRRVNAAFENAKQLREQVNQCPR